MSDKRKVIEWGSSYLASQGCSIQQDPEVIIETPWSLVIHFVTDRGHYYLKQTPPGLFIEASVINAIQKNMADSHLPKIHSKNNDYHCFIMDGCGDHSLRTRFNGKINEDLLVKGLKEYIRIQRSFEENPGSLLAVGVPDWRLSNIPEIYSELLSKKDMLFEEGLSIDELSKLEDLTPQIESICKYVSSQSVKETLVNCDFNENNLIINENTDQISVIDWGESVVGHPFFSIASHLIASARRYGLELSDDLLQNIKQRYISCWSDVASDKDLDEIFSNVMKLLPIFSSFGIYRLQAATKNKSKEKQRWFISGSLKRLLEDEHSAPH